MKNIFYLDKVPYLIAALTMGLVSGFPLELTANASTSVQGGELVNQPPNLEEMLALRHLAVKTARQLKTIAPTLKDRDVARIAVRVATESKDTGVDPRIYLVILKVESDFDQKRVSTTGDYGIAQVNYKIWKRVLKKQGVILDKERLSKDEEYNLKTMSIVLVKYKNQFAAKDGWWFTRYHSHTPLYRNRYKRKILAQLKRIIRMKEPERVSPILLALKD